MMSPSLLRATRKVATVEHVRSFTLLVFIAIALNSCRDEPTAPAALKTPPNLPRLAEQLSGFPPRVSGGEGSTCALKTDGTVVCWGQITFHPVPSELASAIQISDGGSHACALQANATALCWGANQSGELNVPAGTGPLVEIVAGYLHTCAVKADATVICWGDNGLHQTESPADLVGVSQISSDASHTCALKGDGSVVCWGDNRFGQANVPSGLAPVSQVSAGGYHTCALKQDQTVVCWGAASSGQATVPSGLNSVTQLTSGYYFTCALKSDATVICWGDDSRGQLEVTPGLGPVRQVSAGGYHTCAVKTDGTVACWGDVQYGGTAVPAGLNLIVSQPQTITFTSAPPIPVAVGETYSVTATGGPSGNAVTFSSLTSSVCTIQDAVVTLLSPGTCTIGADQSGNQSYLPATRGEQSFDVSSPLPFPATAPQLDASDNHTCALNTSGRVTCWGFNDYGEATPPSNLPPMIRVVAGGYHSCGLQGNGQVICWGHDGYGQSTPPAGLTAVAIGAGTHHTCAVKTSGGVVCWGRDSEGQSDVPVGLSSVVQVDGSAIHSCALKGDGVLLCWGSNAQGQLNVPDGIVVKQVTTGGLTTCALKQETTVACWGYNGGGQAEVPEGLTDINQISSGGHNCALRRDATVICWSYNNNGQLNVPAGLRALIVTAGGYHTCALATDGSVLCWGDSGFNKTAVPPGLNLLGTQTQAILFTSAPPNPAKVGTAYQAVATGGRSGNPVIFKALTPEICGVEPSGAVSIVAAGMCSLEANQAGVGDYLAAPAAQQSFPVVIPNRPPVANAGGPYSANEGQQDRASVITFDGTRSSDPDGNSLLYTWDFGDGRVITGPGLQNYAYADNGTYRVTLTVNDGLVNSEPATSTATIINVAPTAIFSFPSSIGEGGAFSISLDAATDPSLQDRAAGLHYAFDCGAGYDASTSYATAGTSSSRACAGANGPTTMNVRATVFDKDGGSTEYGPSVITIRNLAPAVTLGAASCDCLSPTLVVSFSDAAGSADGDASGNFSVRVSWGDGQVSTALRPIGSYALSHNYAKGGAYTVTANVTDKDRATGSIYRFIDLIQPVSIGISPPNITQQTRSLTLSIASTPVFDARQIDARSLRLGTTAVAKDALGNPRCSVGGSTLSCVLDVAVMRSNGDLVGTGPRTLILTGFVSGGIPRIKGSANVTLR